MELKHNNKAKIILRLSEARPQKLQLETWVIKVRNQGSDFY